MPFFDELELLPDDPILSIPKAFAEDPRPEKVNLGIGAYKTAEGLPLVLTAVKKAEVQIIQKNLNKEYLPIEGDTEFLNYGLQLLFGPLLYQKIAPHLFTAQTVGDSGALRIAGEFFARNISRTIFLSQPSWANHKLIFERSGLNVGSYPYYDAVNHRFDFTGMSSAIQNMPAGSIILLQGSCHNPSGVDPSIEEWGELSALVKKQNLIPFFDIAYQGFGVSLDKDAEAIRYFAEQGHEMAVCYSFSKNFGLYGERVGFLSILAERPESVTKIASQIKTTIRSNYSNPPLQGARIVKTILKSPELTNEWKIELENMRERISEMRKALMAALLVKGSDRDFSYFLHQKGLFSFSGLNPEQTLRLRQEKAIYMPQNGRINVAGLNTQNMQYVADSIISVIDPLR